MKKLPLTEHCQRILLSYGVVAEQMQGACLLVYGPGEPVCHAGHPLGNLLFVIEGRAKACITVPNGRTVLLDFYQDAGVLGDVELMLGTDRATTSVQAVTTFSCVAIPLLQNGVHLRKNVVFLNHIGAALAQKLKRSSNNGAENLLLALETRLCSYISLTSPGGVFSEKLTEAAELLGVSYRHLLRSLEQLCKRGVLEKSPRGYRVLDAPALERLGKEGDGE